MTNIIARSCPRIIPVVVQQWHPKAVEASIHIRACHHVNPRGMSALPVRYVEMLVLTKSPATGCQFQFLVLIASGVCRQ